MDRAANRPVGQPAQSLAEQAADRPPIDPNPTHDGALLQCAYLPVASSRLPSGPASAGRLGSVLFGAPPAVGDDGVPQAATENDAPQVATENAAPHAATENDVPQAAADDDAPPLAQVPMQPLADGAGTVPACEVWATDAAVTYGRRGHVRYGCSEEILFGVIQLAEAQFATAAVRDAGHTPLQHAAEVAYRELFGALDALEFPHVLRVWNYLADINGSSHGSERYRQFNRGRQDGFLASGRAVTGNVPAASAVGFAAGPLTVYFLAGRGPAPRLVENPRQVSAYRYPPAYGERSPTFSRASVARLGGRDVLFLSGTASIVGHETLHVGDVLAQCRETVANIAAMVDEANRVAPHAAFTLAELCYKVYVRAPGDVAAIHATLRALLGPAARLMFLHADICRAGLAMEIEATAGHPLDFAASPS